MSRVQVVGATRVRGERGDGPSRLRINEVNLPAAGRLAATKAVALEDSRGHDISCPYNRRA